MSLTKATYSMIEGAAVSVHDFGAIGDGIADDTAAIQAAINAAAAAGSATNVVEFQRGTYRVTDEILITSGNIIVRGNNAKIKLETSIFEAAFSVAGSVGALMPVTASISQYANSFELSAPNAATLSPGDYVKILSTENYFVTAGRNYKKGEIVKVKSVSGTTVTIEDLGFYLSYTTSLGSITAQKLNLVSNVVIDGFEIEGTGGVGDRQIGIKVYQTENFKAQNCEIYNCETGITLEQSVHSTVSNCFLHDCEKDTGYAISAGGSSQNVLVSNNQFENNRHSFTTGGEDGVCMFLTITGNTVNNHDTVSGASALNTHGNCRFVEFSNNMISNAWAGISCYNPCNKIIDNYILNTRISGIYQTEAAGVNTEIVGNTIIKTSVSFFPAIEVTNLATSAETNEYVFVKNNIIRECGNGIGISVSKGNLPEPANNIQVSNNLIDKPGYEGIVVDGGVNISVDNNLITRPGRSNLYAIRVISSSAPLPPDWVLGTNAVITNNNVNKGSYGISVEETTNLVLQGNIVNVAFPAFYYVLTNVTTVQGTDVLQSPNGTLYRLAVDNAGNVSGVTI